MESLTPTISVVIPIYNEEDTCPELFSRLLKTLESLGESFEVIFVDDGSTDGTLSLVKKASSQDPRLKYLSLSRNFGHQIAISAGIDYARGEAVIVMDGDLQDPPELIPEFCQRWGGGHDVVYAIRKNRKENIFLRSCYSLSYAVIRKIADITIPPNAGDFCLMSRRVVDTITRMPERNRYLRGLRAWAGFRQVGLAYERDRRFTGKSKYSLMKLVKLAVDGMTSFSHFPLRLCGYLGYSMSFLSFLGFIVALVARLTIKDAPIGWFSTIVSIFFLGGIQLIMLSVVGSYIGRIYTEVQQRPLYVVKEAGNIGASLFIRKGD